MTTATKTLKVIKIDVLNRTISEVEIDKKNSLMALQEIVGGRIETCFHMDENGSFDDDGFHMVYADEEALFRTGVQPVWVHKEIGERPWIGNAVIVKVNPMTGDNVQATMDIEELKEKVIFGAVQMRN